MPTITLHAGTVSVNGLNSLDAPSIVGSAAVWDDGLTSTYSETWTSFDSSVGPSAFQSWAMATIDTLALPVGATVNSVTAHMTARTSSNPAVSTPDPRVNLQLHDASHSSSPFATNFQSWTHNDVGSSFASYSQVLGTGLETFLSIAGNTVMIRRQAPLGAPSPYHHNVDVAEFSLVVDYTGTTPAVTVAPALRKHPRSDGLGTSSARRHWPPPKSVQFSNRRAGGYL